MSGLIEHQGFAAGLVLVALFWVLRLLFREEALKQDLGGAVLYFVAFFAAHFSADLLEDLHYAAPGQLVRVISYLLFAFGAIRGAASMMLYAVRSKRGVPTPKILRDVVDAVLYFIAIAVVLRVTTHIDLGTLVGTSAVLSVVIGLALQETLGNLFAGLSLQMERPFQVGDWIAVGEHTGRVLQVAWRATRIVTLRDEHVTIPNSVIGKASVVNFTRSETGFATELALEVAYDVAPNAACSAILEVLSTHPNVRQSPAPTVRVDRYEGSGIRYLVRCWVKEFPLAETLRHELLTQLWYRLKRGNMGIPYPTRTVYLQQLNGEAARQDEQRDVAQLLAQIDFLRPLGPEGLQALGSVARRQVFGRGEVIIRQGEQGETFYVVAEGEVSVGVEANGMASIVARCRRGDFLGEMSLLTGEPRSATVTAVMDTTVLVLDRSGFASFLQSHPEVAKGMSEALAQRRQSLNLAVVGAQVDQGAVTRESNRILGRLREIFRIR